jgi:hypothetical protein
VDNTPSFYKGKHTIGGGEAGAAFCSYLTFCVGKIQKIKYDNCIEVHMLQEVSDYKNNASNKKCLHPSNKTKNMSRRMKVNTMRKLT